MDFSFVNKIENTRIPIYLTSHYLKIISENDNCEYKILKIVLKNGLEIYLPFLFKKIVQNTYEAFSAYGYGGFYSGFQSNLAKIEIKRKWRKFENFMKDNGIIDLFIRNSPFLSNHDFVPEKYNEYNRTTYSRKLGFYKNMDDLTKNVKHKLKCSISHAIKSGVSVEFHTNNDLKENELLKFYEMYSKTMKKREADEYYYFTLDFFKKHFVLFENNCELALVKEKESKKIIGVSIFLLDELKLVYYHFSAFNRDYSKYCPTTLLLAEAILRYGNLGYSILFFGGGISRDGNDGLSKFKKKFATNEQKFYISKIIFDSDRYYNLRSKFKVEKSNLFLIKDAVANEFKDE